MKRIAIAILALAVGACALADTEFFEVKHTAGKTVYFRFFDTSQGAGVNVYTFDFDDDAWETSLGACADPKLAATEKTDSGDADESLYVASTNLATMYNTAASKRFVVQAMEDLATDEVIAEAELWITAGVRVEPADVKTWAGTATVAGAIPAVAAGAAGGLPDDTDANGRVRVVDGTGAGEIDTTSGRVGITGLVDASAAKLDDILDGTGGTGLTLNSLVINGTAAGGVVDIDNAGGPGIDVDGTTFGLDIDSSAGPGIAVDGEQGMTIHGAAAIWGFGIEIAGTGTGNGVYVAGGNASDAVKFSATANGFHGMHLSGQGTGSGLYTQRNVAGSGYGIDASLGGINGGTLTANITGNITGNLVGTVSTLTTYTGNTPQTADHTASIAAILLDTGTTLPATLAGLSTLTQAQVQASVTAALTAFPAAKPTDVRIIIP